MKKIAFLLAVVMLLSCLTACGSTEGTASVESVSMICGIGSVGLAERFAGVVSAQGETGVEKSDRYEVKDILVKVGDEVKEGQTLFTYDQSSAQLDLERAKLELENLKNTLSNKKAEKTQLENDKQNVSADEQLAYNLEIREVTTVISETEYNISLKQQEIQQLSSGIGSSEVKAPADGRIKSINENGGSDSYGNPLPFMTIAQTDSFRVKGYVNETNAQQLAEGTPVIVRSRVSDESWSGTISSIDWNNPQQNNNSYYYDGSDDTSSSSKYPFYVELDGSEGLLLGQHVYIEPDIGQDGVDTSAINLPEWYINDADSSPWVWAQSERGKLEKRSVTLGDYDADMCTYPVLDGLTADDYIAYPDETLKTGMECVPYDEGTFEPDMGDTGDMGGVDDNFGVSAADGMR